MNDSHDDTIDYSSQQQSDPNRDLSRLVARLDIRLDRLERQIEAGKSSPGESARGPETSVPPFVSLNGARPKTFATNLPHLASDQQFKPPNQATSPFSPDSPASAEGLVFSEIQERYQSVKQSVDKVILPPHLKLHDSRSGVKRDDQPTLNVITKCARYVETIFKLLSQAKEAEPLELESLYTVLFANIKYLQEEYAALLVKGKFDDSTAQLFRSLQRNNSGFDQECIQNVRIAAELSSIGNRFQQAPRRGSRPFRGRGRSYYNRNTDIFNSFQGPRSRTPGNKPTDDFEQ